MKDPLGISPSKENQGTTQGKEKNSSDLGGNQTHSLQIVSFETPIVYQFPSKTSY